MPAATHSHHVLFALALLVCCSSNADSAEFFGLGLFPGDVTSTAYSVSDDGSVVVGAGSSSPQFSDNHGFRWTRDAGMQEIATIDSRPGVVSGDGNVVAGHYWPSTIGTMGFYWTAAKGFIPTGLGTWSGISGASHDGATLVGRVGDGSNAVRWTPQTGFVSLGSLPGYGQIGAADVSSDGSVVVGPGPNLTVGYSFRAWRWTAATGIIGLGDPSVLSTAVAVSGDGSVIVGHNWPDGSQDRHSFRWTEESGVVALESPGILRSSATDVSRDGSIIVGNAQFDATGVNEAFIWTTSQGMRPLDHVLIDEYGLSASLSGWTNLSARSISADGRTIVGSATNPNGIREAWYANLRAVPEPATGALALMSVVPAYLVLRSSRRRL